MKKLLVVLLAAVMVLSLAAIAMAADTWMGGDMFFKYNSAQKAWVADDSVFTVGNITAKVSKDNTWAKTFLNIDTWQGLNKSKKTVTCPVATDPSGQIDVVSDAGFAPALNYACGIDKLGGLVSLSFSTKDQDLCNIGQAQLEDSFDDFKTDPIFNTYECTNSFGMVIDGSSFAVKAEAVAIGTANPNPFAIEAIFKFDGGKAYIAYKGNAATWDVLYGGNTLIDGGAEMKFGDLNVKADVWAVSFNSASLGTMIQGNVGSGPWDATLNVQLPPPGGGNSVIGVGGNYTLGDLTLGLKYIAYNPNARYELLATYQVGVIGLRAGYVNPGTGSTDNNYFVLGVHAGIW